MADLKRTELSVQAERAVLVQARLPDGAPGAGASAAEDGASADSSLEELRSLARTARTRIVGEMTQMRRRRDPKFYVGRGKARELAGLCRRRRADIVLCDDDLSPTQVKSLEVELDVKVIDRSELILGIFATHARTRQAKLQVELAQLEYALPRLRKMWTHLDRTAGTVAGGGVGVRGPGEKQLEVDRRLARKRIYDLKRELKKAEMRRRLTVHRRQDQFTTITLVGYTNAGKSTLMNALTGAGVSVRDRLFETLDTRTRAWDLPGGRRVMLSDTVGFIRKLPHHLVASFHATLEDVRQADLLLHVADAASPTARQQINAVRDVLEQMGCTDKPALLALNKMDALPASGEALACGARPSAESFLPTVAISALSGEGLEELAARVEELLQSQQVELTVETSAGNGKLLSLLHERATVLDRAFSGETVRLRVRAPQGLAGLIRSLGGQTSETDHEIASADD